MNETVGAAVLVQLLLTTPPLATLWLTQRDPEGGLSAPGPGVPTWQGLVAMALVCVLEWLLIRRERLYRARTAAPPEPLRHQPGTLTGTALLAFYWFGSRPWPGLAGFAAATSVGSGLLMVEGSARPTPGGPRAPVPTADKPEFGGFRSPSLSSDDGWRRQRS